MPITVPVYRQQVGTAPLPGVRQNLTDQTGRALEGIGAEMRQASKEWQHASDQADNAAVNDAYAKLMADKQALLEDPENGILAQRGQNALLDRGTKSFEDSGKRIRATLSNDRQRADFDRRYQSEALSFQSAVDRHAAREADALAEQSFSSAMSASLSAAIASGARGELDTAQEHIAQGRHDISERARLMGWEAGVTDQAQRAFETSAHLSIVDSMLDAGRTGDAREYLTSARRYMDEAKIAGSGVVNRLEAATARDRSRVLADQAWQSNGGDTGKAVDWLRAQGIEDTNVFDDAVQRVQQRGAQAAQDRRLADAPRLGRIEQGLLTSGTFSRNSDDFVRLSDEGKADALRMWRAEQRSRNARAHEQNRYDLDAMADFRARAANDPVGAAALDLQSTYQDATIRGRNNIAALQGKVRKDVARGQGVTSSAFAAQVRERAGSIYPKDKAKAAGFVNYMMSRYYEWRESQTDGSDTPPPPDVVQKMIGDALVEGEETEGFWNTNMRAWDAASQNLPFRSFEQETPVAPSPAPAPSIPDDERQLIIQSLKKRGVANPSDAQVMDLYRKAHPNG